MTHCSNYKKIVEDSATVNAAQLYQEPTCSHPSFKWYYWASFLDERFKPVIGIRSLQHFRFSSKFPGDVFVKESGTAKERKINILRAMHPAIRKSLLPPVITAASLTQERERYLFSTIREHIWDPYKDITCPNPDI